MTVRKQRDAQKSRREVLDTATKNLARPTLLHCIKGSRTDSTPGVLSAAKGASAQRKNSRSSWSGAAPMRPRRFWWARRDLNPHILSNTGT